LQKQAISISLEIACFALLGKHPQAPLIAGNSPAAAPFFKLLRACVTAGFELSFQNHLADNGFPSIKNRIDIIRKIQYNRL
jgi:hypothetical protein